MIIEETKKIVDEVDFSNFKNKSILITGGSGIIGIYLLSCLKHIQKSHNLDISVWIKSEIDPNFEDFFDGCKIIKEDITNEKVFDNIPNFDCIIHAAGYGQPNKFLQDKIKTITLNTTSTINLFSKLNPKGKFLFVSTSELYSGLDFENIDETKIGITNTNHPRASYIEGKRCGETICNSFLEFGYDVKIIRLSLAYGPGTKKNDQRVLNSLIEKGLKNTEIELMDSGDALRTYCYIQDVIEMFWNILLHGKKTTYNVGGMSKVSILELAQMIGKILNKKIKVPTISNELKGNPKIVNISIDEYQKEFNKKSFIDLNLGLEKTIEWQKKIYK